MLVKTILSGEVKWNEKRNSSQQAQHKECHHTTHYRERARERERHGRHLRGVLERRELERFARDFYGGIDGLSQRHDVGVLDLLPCFEFLTHAYTRRLSLSLIILASRGGIPSLYHLFHDRKGIYLDNLTLLCWPHRVCTIRHVFYLISKKGR